MKVLNGEIYNDIRPALGKLIQVQLPVGTAFAVAKFSAKVQEQLTTIENVRNGLIARYGETNEKTGQPVIGQDSPNWAKFSAEYDELMNIEAELPDEKITIPAKVDGHDIKIEASILIGLEKFVVMA